MEGESHLRLYLQVLAPEMCGQKHVASVSSHAAKPPPSNLDLSSALEKSPPQRRQARGLCSWLWACLRVVRPQTLQGGEVGPCHRPGTQLDRWSQHHSSLLRSGEQGKAAVPALLKDHSESQVGVVGELPSAHTCKAFLLPGLFTTS